MQIEKEDSNKIRIILKPIDLAEMNVSIENLKPDSPQLHNFLYEIMERVREETGFNPYAGQIVVEALPIGEGMILTVTRISQQKKTAVPPKAKIRRVKAVINDKSKKKSTAFVFDSFDDFCSALTVLNKETLIKSDYYKLNNKNVLLVNGATLCERSVLKEYAISSKSGGVVNSYMSEYGKHIAGGESLISMADGISRLQPSNNTD